jgi:hypothetical protein
MIRDLRFGFVVAALLVAANAIVLPGAAEQPTGTEDADAGARTARFVAYYFHGKVRCATCRKLEAYSREAITQGFTQELESGTLAWRTVNTDEPDNAHLVGDFELVAKSVVLVEYRDGEVVRFENLRLVWQLVGDKDGFVKYVRDSTREFIGQG